MESRVARIEATAVMSEEGGADDGHSEQRSLSAHSSDSESGHSEAGRSARTPAKVLSESEVNRQAAAMAAAEGISMTEAIARVRATFEGRGPPPPPPPPVSSLQAAVAAASAALQAYAGDPRGGGSSRAAHSRQLSRRSSSVSLIGPAADTAPVRRGSLSAFASTGDMVTRSYSFGGQQQQQQHQPYGHHASMPLSASLLAAQGGHSHSLGSHSGGGTLTPAALPLGPLGPGGAGGASAAAAAAALHHSGGGSSASGAGAQSAGRAASAKVLPITFR